MAPHLAGLSVREGPFMTAPAPPVALAPPSPRSGGPLPSSPPCLCREASCGEDAEGKTRGDPTLVGPLPALPPLPIGVPERWYEQKEREEDEAEEEELALEGRFPPLPTGRLVSPPRPPGSRTPPCDFLGGVAAVAFGGGDSTLRSFGQAAAPNLHHKKKTGSAESNKENDTK